MALEKDIQKQIINWLSLKRIFHYKNNTAGIYKQKTGTYIPSQSVGAPDIVCIVHGRYWGIEVKALKGVLSDSQRSFGENIEKAGGIYTVARSVAEVEKAYKQII